MNWKVLKTGAMTAEQNMAFDASLLEEVMQDGQPVFRLYSWKPYAFSVGRFQKAQEELDLEALQHAGLDWVMRMTGGGVLYHGPEITYSLASRADIWGQGLSVKETYRKICAFLILFYQKIGLKACFAGDNLVPGHIELGKKTAYCMAGREEMDITVGDKKIGGNAQRRFRDFVFQHGSIPLVLPTVGYDGFVKNLPAGWRETVTTLSGEGIQIEYSKLESLVLESFLETVGK